MKFNIFCGLVKRNGEDEIAKAVSAKKQKIERDETVVAKQKAEENKPKKVESNCESKDDSSSEDESKVKYLIYTLYLELHSYSFLVSWLKRS